MKTFKNYLNKKESLFNEETFERNHVSISVFGAPAGGKSYTIEKIKEFENSLKGSKKLASAIDTGVNLVVDKLREEIREMKPKEQIKRFYLAFFEFKNLSKKEEKNYGSWFKDIEKILKEKIIPFFKENGIIFNDELLTTANIIEFNKLLNKINDSDAKVFIESLNSYEDYKRITRFKQISDQKRGAKKNKDLIFDEVGDDYSKVLSNLKTLRDKNPSYINIIILIQGKTPLTNLIQNAGRMVSGNDGGRDSSKAIISAFNSIQESIPMYQNASEVFKVFETPDYNSIFKLLKETTIKDNEHFKDKIVDLFVQIQTENPNDSFNRIIKGLDGVKKELFIAIMYFYTKHLSLNSKIISEINTLISSYGINDKSALEIFKKAKEQKLDFPNSNLDEKIKKLGGNVESNDSFYHHYFKKVNNLYYEQKNKKKIEAIFLDMDGTIADFENNPRIKKAYDYKKNDFEWSDVGTFPISGVYSSLEPFSSNPRLINFLKKIKEKKDIKIYILSGCPKLGKYLNAEEEKTEWLKKHGFSELITKNIFTKNDPQEKINSAKQVISDLQKSILIDDNEKNIEGFLTQGHAIKYNPKNFSDFKEKILKLI